MNCSQLSPAARMNKAAIGSSTISPAANKVTPSVGPKPGMTGDLTPA